MTGETEKCVGCAQKAVTVLELIDSVEDLKRRLEGMSVHLLDDERLHAKAVWEAALFAHQKAKPGDPGPWTIIASALADASAVSGDDVFTPDEPPDGTAPAPLPEVEDDEG